MTKIKFLTVISLLAFISCSKDGGEDTIPAPVQVNENTFSIKVNDDFSTPGKVSDSRRKLSNIRVGDKIPYTIEVVDTAEGEAVYSFFAVEEDTKFHQVLNKDYKLHIEATDENIDIDTAKGVIKFRKKGTYTFYIEPLLAGTYKLLFNFQKQKEGKVVGDNLKQEILFNAVKIRVWADREETKTAGTFNHSRHRNNFYFNIDDGKDQDDVYLTSRDGISQKYFIKYNGVEYSGNFNQGDIYFTRSDEREVYPPSIDNRLVDYIRIVQVMPDKKETEIDYYEIEVVKNYD